MNGDVEERDQEGLDWGGNLGCWEEPKGLLGLFNPEAVLVCLSPKGGKKKTEQNSKGGGVINIKTKTRTVLLQRKGCGPQQETRGIYGGKDD